MVQIVLDDRFNQLDKPNRIVQT